MTRAPDWTSKEFETLLQNDELTDDEMAGLLTSRTRAAIGVVREGIHAYHASPDPSILSEMMKRRLDDGSHPYQCQRCRLSG